MKITLNKILPLLIIIICMQSCTTLQIVKRVNGGKIALNTPTKSIIPFELKGHPILIKCRLNNSTKEYKFMFDTGAITLVTPQVANELELQDAIEIELQGTGGKSAKVNLVQLKNVTVGKSTVQNVAAVIVDFEKKHGVKIDGILGSNFLKFFQVTINYQKHEITLLHSTEPLSTKNDNDIQIPFETNMRSGFAPQVECIINGDITSTGIIDTGYPGVAGIPLSLMKKMSSFKNGNFVKASGSMVGGIVGMAKESYAMRLDSLKISSLQINNIPSISHSSKNDQILLGNKFLSKFLVTIDYLLGKIILSPYKATFDTNIFTYGLNLSKKNNKTIVTGVWDNSSAFKAGICINDEIVQINSINAELLSAFDLMAIFLNENINSIKIVYIHENSKHTIDLKKEKLLPIVK